MEINEKLDTFYQAAIDAATEQSAAMQREYEEWHRASIAEYEQGRQQEQRASGRIAQEQVRKEINRRTSEEMLRLKKEFHEQQELRKGELFELV